MKIPKEFKIFGQTIKVKYSDDLVQKTDNYKGIKHKRKVGY